MTTDPRRPWETWYNGWSWAERCAVTPIQNAMFRSGQLARPTICSICGFSDPARINGSGYIFAHTEMYDRPDVLFPACKRCHAALHARPPLAWLALGPDQREPTISTHRLALASALIDIAQPQAARQGAVSLAHLAHLVLGAMRRDGLLGP